MINLTYIFTGEKPGVYRIEQHAKNSKLSV